MNVNDYIGKLEPELSTTKVNKKTFDCIRISNMQNMRIVILQTKVLDIA